MVKRDETYSSKPKFVLVDYGMAQRYVDDNGNHMENDEIDLFCGNITFASLNTLNFRRPSRRDDLIMICYLMIFLVNGG